MKKLVIDLGAYPEEVINTFAAANGYPETVQDPSTGYVIPNPVSKEGFLVATMSEMIISITKKAAGDAAYAQMNAAVEAAKEAAALKYAVGVTIEEI